eukprot:5114744-Pyramimonas_sp.AAC.1
MAGRPRTGGPGCNVEGRRERRIPHASVRGDQRQGSQEGPDASRARGSPTVGPRRRLSAPGPRPEGIRRRNA